MGPVGPKTVVSCTSAAPTSATVVGTPPEDDTVSVASTRPVATDENLRPQLPVIHRMAHTAAELDPQGTIERIRHETGQAQLHALQVVRLLEKRRLTVVLDGFVPPIAAKPRLQLGHGSPVPPPFLIQESELECRVSQPIADLNRRAEPPLAEHVSKHDGAAGSDEGAEGAPARAQIRLADVLERQPRGVVTMDEARRVGHTSVPIGSDTIDETARLS